VIAGVLEGDLVKITQVVAVQDMFWGKCRAGWLCLDYSDYSGGLPVGEPGEQIPQIPGTPTVPETQKQSGETAVDMGTVTANQLAIRSAAGSRGTPVGTYRKGDRVALLEVATVSGVLWGRTEQGWISLIYVELDEMEHEKLMEAAIFKGEIHVQNIFINRDEIPQGYAAIVSHKSGLNARSQAGAAGEIVHTYAPGETIRILEQTSVDGILWGCTEHGWVCMEHVQVEDTAMTVAKKISGKDSDTEEDSRTSDGSREEITAIYGTVAAVRVNVRRLPGASGEPVAYYHRGDQISILEMIQLNGQIWGRTDKGWISLVYVDLEEVSGEEPGVTGEVTLEGLCIRQGPGSGNTIVGVYSQGQTVIILEQLRVGLTLWGRTIRGWVCMDYVE